MQREIVGFHQDEQGEWVAELACGHDRHVRHRPPLFPEPWVLDGEGREERIGTPLECGLCDRGGEAACFANLVCPECGVVLDGSPHRPGCTQEHSQRDEAAGRDGLAAAVVGRVHASFARQGAMATLGAGLADIAAVAWPSSSRSSRDCPSSTASCTRASWWRRSTAPAATPR